MKPLYLQYILPLFVHLRVIDMVLKMNVFQSIWLAFKATHIEE